jgi:hypothetical protein
VSRKLKKRLTHITVETARGHRHTFLAEDDPLDAMTWKPVSRLYLTSVSFS